MNSLGRRKTKPQNMEKAISMEEETEIVIDKKYDHIPAIYDWD